MPINANHEFFTAEKKYLAAKTLEEKIFFLEEMIREAPGHKGSENLLKELRTRLRKFKEKKEKGRKVGKGKKGIRKEGYQVALVGLTNSGKSCLLRRLTNAKPRISPHPFTTKEMEVGSMDFEGVKVQIIDFPSFGGKDVDYGTLNTADCLLLVIEKLEDLEKVEKYMSKTYGKKVVVQNKIDNFGVDEKRKINARMKSKRLNYIIVSCESGEGIESLKKKIFEGMGVIRVYTKEPGKEKTKDPIVLSEGSSVRDAAEKILKGFSLKVKETRLTGPSGKFSNQRVGLKHKLKDKDILEFRVK